MSAAALAEYLIQQPDQQEETLRNSRFSSPYITTAHQGAMRAIKEYNSDHLRRQSILDSAKEELNVKSTDLSITPKQREECLRCIETINLFETGENAFGLRALPLETAPRFPPLIIHNVTLSIQPDLLVRSATSKGVQKVGAVFFRPQKTPDPVSCKTEETKTKRVDHRRELARYVLTMSQMLLETKKDLFGTFNREHSFVADIRLGERVPFSTTDHAARVRRIEAACRQISSLWDDITPK